MTFTTKEVQDALGVMYGTAFAITAILNDTRDPDQYPTVRHAEEQAERELPHWHKILLACSELMGRASHGVRIMDNVAFVDVGDTSYQTVIYDLKRESFYIQSLNQWGALYG